MKKNKGKIITVTSSKGGIGKTIFLLNLAGVYQKLERRVLILDFDFSNGGIALNLNLEPQKNIYHVAEDIHNHRYFQYQDYVTSYSEYIDVIVAPKDPRQATKIDVKDLISLLEETVYHYDVVLIDTCHGLSKNNILTLDHSDTILYLISNDFMDLKNSKNFMAIMKDAEFDHVKIVLNKSRDLEANYFSDFDIKNLIKTNIDYIIPASFHVKNITRIILEGQIITLNKNIFLGDKKELDKFNKMALELIGEESD